MAPRGVYEEMTNASTVLVSFLYYTELRLYSMHHI